MHRRWSVRRTRLEQLAASWAAPQASPVTAVVTEAHEWFEILPEAIGMEGPVGKGARLRYVGGRRAWLKVKHRDIVEVIVGDVLGPITRPEVVIPAATPAMGRWSRSAVPRSFLLHPAAAGQLNLRPYGWTEPGDPTPQMCERRDNWSLMARSCAMCSSTRTLSSVVRRLKWP